MTPAETLETRALVVEREAARMAERIGNLTRRVDEVAPLVPDVAAPAEPSRTSLAQES